MGDALRFSRLPAASCGLPSYVAPLNHGHPFFCRRRDGLPQTPISTSLQHHPRTSSLSSTPLSSRRAVTTRIKTPSRRMQPGCHIAALPKDTGVSADGRRWAVPCGTMPSGGPSSPIWLSGWLIPNSTAASFVRERLNADPNALRGRRCGGAVPPRGCICKVPASFASTVAFNEPMGIDNAVSYFEEVVVS